ncbi:hypothetical protein LJC35_05750 [Parabacteroides sp. OttesenSCG-928-N08]|nr:hypothetical protein [Parabacteroides sp. OttesenSCG-928-N08]
MNKLRKNSLLKVFFILLYVGFYVGNTAFVHTHNYLTFSVTHSHPFLNAAEGGAEHTHNKASIDTIEQINTILFDFILFVAAVGIVSQLLTLFIQPCRSAILLRVVHGCRLRAPPASVY